MQGKTVFVSLCRLWSVLRADFFMQSDSQWRVSRFVASHRIVPVTHVGTYLPSSAVRARAAKTRRRTNEPLLRCPRNPLLSSTRDRRRQFHLTQVRASARAARVDLCAHARSGKQRLCEPNRKARSETNPITVISQNSDPNTLLPQHVFPRRCPRQLPSLRPAHVRLLPGKARRNNRRERDDVRYQYSPQ